jgi:hypothetical protein
MLRSTSCNSPTWQDTSCAGHIVTFHCRLCFKPTAGASASAHELAGTLDAQQQQRQQQEQEQDGQGDCAAYSDVLLRLEVIGRFNAGSGKEMHHVRLMHDVPASKAPTAATAAAAEAGDTDKLAGSRLLFQKGQAVALRLRRPKSSSCSGQLQDV